jgi:hypothetical protein
MTVRSFNEIRLELKKDSKYWPDVLIREYDNVYEMFKEGGEPEPKIIYASTLVRIERDGKWYIVHCLENFIPTSRMGERELLLRLINNVHHVQLFHIINREIMASDGKFLEDVDSLQISEKQRIIDQFHNVKL